MCLDSLLPNLAIGKCEHQLPTLRQVIILFIQVGFLQATWFPVRLWSATSVTGFAGVNHGDVDIVETASQATRSELLAACLGIWLTSVESRQVFVPSRIRGEGDRGAAETTVDVNRNRRETGRFQAGPDLDSM